MDSVRYQAFADELEKISARRGLKIIRRLVAQGNIEEASRLAKTPGVLRDAGEEVGERFMAGGKPKWMEREFLGSQIKHLGQGQEQLSTLVADPVHGIAVRKIRHGGAVSPPSMNRAVGSFMSEAAPATAKRLEDARHGFSGRHVSFNEYVPGRPGQAGDLAVARARNAVLKKAKETGTIVDDLRPENAVVFDKGRQAKFVDLLADKRQNPRNLLGQAKSTPETKTILQRTFKNPLAVDRQSLAKDRAVELAKVKKPAQENLGDFMARADTAPKTPKKSDRDLAIEAFLKAKKEKP
jgi:hypothetical protein